jgi:rRNA maturation endonuclease Nob1
MKDTTMAQRTLEAIDAKRTDTRGTLHWAIRSSRWEITCGSCRTHFPSAMPFYKSSADCPICGARNVLPHSKSKSGR